MFLKCIKYKKGSLIEPIKTTINSNSKKINSAITPNESPCNTEVLGKPSNSVTKPPIQANTIKCTKDMTPCTINEDPAMRPNIIKENPIILPSTLPQSIAESDIPPAITPIIPVASVVPNTSSLSTEKEISPSKTISSSSNPLNNPLTASNDTNSHSDLLLKKSVISNSAPGTNLAPIPAVASNTPTLKGSNINKSNNKPNILRNISTTSHNTYANSADTNSNFNDTNILRHSLPIVSKSLHTENDTVVLLFSCQINIMLSKYIRIFFMVKRYSSAGSPITLGNTPVFASFGNNEKCKSFSFQMLDTDLTPGKYTYCVEAYSNSFKVLPLGLIILNPYITLITGNQF